MDMLADGSVMHGGTYNANAMAIAAALAALDQLSTDGGASHARLCCVSGLLIEGLEDLSKSSGGSFCVQGVGPVFNTTFDAPSPITDYRSYQASNIAKQIAFITALDAEGVRVTGRGTWFVSTEHSEADVERTLELAEQALREVG
jgi:glutamate-1-semialdehyde 2,1-aminomutase